MSLLIMLFYFTVHCVLLYCAVLRRSSGGLAAIPLRFLSRMTFTSLAAPSNFDAALLKRSMALPAAECSRYA